MALKKTNCWGFSKVHTRPKASLADVCFATEEEVLIGYQNGRIDKVRIVLPLQVVSHQSLFSNKLYLKCLPVPLSKFLVGVVLDCSKDSINTQLHLVNTDSFENLSIFEFDEPWVSKLLIFA